MTNLRVFLSAPFERRADLREIAAQLAQRDLEVVSRWINAPDHVTEENASQVVREAAIERDLEDIVACDVFVAFAWDGGRGGRHVELGFALSCATATHGASPSILLVGEPQHLFHHHPFVAHYPLLSSPEALALAIKTARVCPNCGCANGLHPLCRTCGPMGKGERDE